jgi:hypothetical protein
MHLGNAIAAHDEWKARFRTAIVESGTLDATTISADHCCELGKWLHGEGKTLFGKLSMHAHCVATHKIFHHEAGQIAEVINAKKFIEAHGMMAAHTPFTKASTALTAAILRLNKDAESSSGITSLIAKLSR